MRGQIMKKEVYKIFKMYCQQYKLNNYKSKKLWSIIRPICYHKEFLKRLQTPFWHHDIKTLGEHIICDAIVTYKIIDKVNKKNKKAINIYLAVIIAMFHDLYEKPWQNNLELPRRKFKNNHGFTHPIEAITNAITWFPNYFIEDKDTLIIIDGVIHHMFPFPVRIIDNDLELNNQEKYEKLDDKYKKIIKLSTNIGKVGIFSIRKSFYIEGRIMSKADKIVAIRKDLKSIDGYISFLTGKNKKLLKKEEKI